MVAITYGAARAAAVAITGTESKPGLFARFWAALIESRMRAAEREIALHAHLLTNFEKDAVFGHNAKR